LSTIKEQEKSVPLWVIYLFSAIISGLVTASTGVTMFLYESQESEMEKNMVSIREMMHNHEKVQIHSGAMNKETLNVLFKSIESQLDKIEARIGGIDQTIESIRSILYARSMISDENGGRMGR